MKEIKAQEGKKLLPKEFHLSPPQPLLPPIHPLLELKQSENQRKMAIIEIIIKKIRSKAHEMDSVRDWKQLIDKKTQLQELFTTAEKGINENRASMARFYEIIKENIKHQEGLQKEIQSTKQRIMDYRQVEQEFTHYVDKYSVFEKFLESVAGVEESWRNVRDVLNRYETLQSTSSECARILENELEQAADLRKRMLTLLETKSSKLKALNNRLILLEVQRKDARDRRVYWEHMMQRIKYTVLDKMQEAISLNKGINDLYYSMCMKIRVVPGLLSSDTQGQVDFIHKTIMFYKEVVTIASGFKSPPGKKDDVENRTRKSKIKKNK